MMQSNQKILGMVLVVDVFKLIKTYCRTCGTNFKSDIQIRFEDTISICPYCNHIGRIRNVDKYDLKKLKQVKFRVLM